PISRPGQPLSAASHLITGWLVVRTLGWRHGRRLATWVRHARTLARSGSAGSIRFAWRFADSTRLAGTIPLGRTLGRLSAAVRSGRHPLQDAVRRQEGPGPTGLRSW